MKKISLKLKITLWYSLIMLLISAVLLSATYFFGRDFMDHDIKNRLVHTVESTAERLTKEGFLSEENVLSPPKDPNFNGGNPPFPKEGHEEDFGFRFYDRGIHLVIYDESGTLLEGQEAFGLDHTLPFTLSDRARAVTQDGNRYYLYDQTVTVDGQTYWVRGMAAGAESGGTLNSVVKIAIPVVLLMLLLAALGGYFILSRAFVPVNKIREAAEEISQSGDLSQRIAIGEAKDEITSLANTFDHMLARLEDSFEREKQFTSDASHELRTPIAVIRSECEYMDECAETVDDYKESVASVSRQADKMAKLVSELLTISRMDKNTMAINFESIDLSELVTFVSEEQKEIHPEGPRLTTNIKEGVTANADRFLMARLMANLLSNAYQYTPKEGSITVSLDEDETNVTFSVQDTGIGISEEDLPKIWERFYQADSARTNENGSMGLGLSMVSWIADCHKGQVTVDSTPGKGSTFTFTFPK